MRLPTTGRVVVIDDDFREALPLLKVLARHGTPSAYYSGRRAELPSAPLVGIRVVFLDLQLVPSEDSKTICSAIAGTLKNIISAENGPYLLFVWSKHDADWLADVTALFDAELKAIRPVRILSLEKNTYQTPDEGGGYAFIPKALELIEAKLKAELTNANAFHLFVLWENAVAKAATNVVNELAALYELGDQWEVNMAGVFRQLAAARVGRNLEPGEQAGMCQAALETLGSVFGDGIERGVASSDFSGLGPIPQGNAVDIGIRARVNRRLLLADCQKLVRPGDVFRSTHAVETAVGETFDFRFGEISFAEKNNLKHSEIVNDKGKLLLKYKKGVEAETKQLKDDIIRAVGRIKIEVSPTCDWAQKKWRSHRFLRGLLWPMRYKPAISRAEYLYTSPVVEWDGAPVVLVFDLRHLYACKLIKNSPRRLFSIRQGLLVDIQQKLAHHISRPGIEYLA